MPRGLDCRRFKASNATWVRLCRRFKARGLDCRMFKASNAMWVRRKFKASNATWVRLCHRLNEECALISSKVGSMTNGKDIDTLTYGFYFRKGGFLYSLHSQ